MFRNIMVPIDGSALSRKAVKKAVALAKLSGAKITGFHVAPAYKFNVYADYIPPNFVLPKDFETRSTQNRGKTSGGGEKRGDCGRCQSAMLLRHQ